MMGVLLQENEETAQPHPNKGSHLSVLLHCDLGIAKVQDPYCESCKNQDNML